MVVTDSREAAVRYKVQMDRYIKDHGYQHLQTLVAFSGTVKIDVDFPGEWTEGNMNHLKGQGIPEAFDSEEYQVLIVAEKFQTGFDQPKLCAMYVDKRLDGIAAVQTLSRLNRTYHGPLGEKDRTYILDFVNEAEGVQKAFQPYYEATMLENATDPNRVHDLIDALDAYAIPTIYTIDDIDAFATAYLEEQKSGAVRQTRLNNLIAPIKNRFISRRNAAREANDTNELEESKVFRKRIGSFGRYYRFLSQLYNFGDSMIGKREIFYEYLARNIRESETGERVDITDVQLTRFKLTKTFDDAIRLAPNAGSVIPGVADDISFVTVMKAYVPLSEVVELMNEFFGADTGEEDRVRYKWIAEILNKVVGTPDIVAQAKNNTEEKFALGDAPKQFQTLLFDALYGIRDKNETDAKGIERIEEVMQDDGKRERLIGAFIRGAYRTIKENPDQVSTEFF
ncbi:MAG: type I restriction enzyme subunit R domain-containing protein [Candidatus Baltobacteraceae bacterium]